MNKYCASSLLFFCIISGCRNVNVRDDVKIINFHGDSNAIVMKDKDGYFTKVLVKESIITYCTKNNFIFGYRVIPKVLYNDGIEDTGFADLYRKNLGAFKFEIDTKKVTYYPNLSNEKIEEICK